MRTAFIAAFLLVSATALAQAPAFEVASIHQEVSPRNYIRTQVKGDLFIAEGANAGVLIRYAYDLKDFQLAGGPNWIRDRDVQFAIQARVVGDPRVDRVRVMVQQLLAERFQLKAHMDRRSETI